MRLIALLAGLCLAAVAAQAQDRSPKAERFCASAPCFPGFDAYFSKPTTRYPHAVLGDGVEWGALYLSGEDGGAKSILDNARVFEDLAPRMVDIDGDGVPELAVIESHENLGAALAIYKMQQGRLVKTASTPHIGTRFRWLAPAGIADFDGNGSLDFAYIDRPHLAKTLRIWSLTGSELTEIAAISGLTNHRIGEDFISGGLRNCKNQPEIVTADAGWSRVLGTRFLNGQWVTRVLANTADTPSFAQAMGCN